MATSHRAFWAIDVAAPYSLCEVIKLAVGRKKRKTGSSNRCLATEGTTWRGWGVSKKGQKFSVKKNTGALLQHPLGAEGKLLKKEACRVNLGGGTKGLVFNKLPAVPTRSGTNERKNRWILKSRGFS